MELYGQSSKLRKWGDIYYYFPTSFRSIGDSFRIRFHMTDRGFDKQAGAFEGAGKWGRMVTAKGQLHGIAPEVRPSLMLCPLSLKGLATWLQGANLLACLATQCYGGKLSSRLNNGNILAVFLCFHSAIPSSRLKPAAQPLLFLNF